MRNINKIAKKIVAYGDFIASNEAYWSWEYDSREHLATISVENDDKLRLTIVVTSKNDGINKHSTRKTVVDQTVGTLHHPKLSLIRSLMTQNNIKKSRSGKGFNRLWSNHKGEKQPLKVILQEYLNNNNNSRVERSTWEKIIIKKIKTFDVEQLENLWEIIK